MNFMVVRDALLSWLSDGLLGASWWQVDSVSPSG